MTDFDDFRNLTQDEDENDFSFEDFVEDDEFGYGQEIELEGAQSTTTTQPGPINQLLGSMTAQQRLILSMMLFGNVLLLSVGMLLATGRIG
ncbi:MAG: hypothetical protein ACFE0Q_06280 [Anaerolineae bacterium]